MISYNLNRYFKKSMRRNGIKLPKLENGTTGNSGFKKLGF